LTIKALGIEELELVREVCVTLRQRALIECLYATGCRLSEVRNLNVSDVNFHKMSTKVFGKGGKERIVYLSFKKVYHLKRYLNSRQNNCECKALFVSERKPYRRTINRSIEREINRVGEMANLEKGLSPHWFIRTLATLLLDSGAELAAVQAILGHEDPDTTLCYAKCKGNRSVQEGIV